jgi:hypothetical protein
MKRLLLLSTLLTLGLSLAFVTGCDEDKDGTGPTEKAVGDTLDPVFGAIEGGFEGIDEMTPMLLAVSLEFMDSVFNDPGHPAPGKWSIGVQALGVAADSFLHTYHSNSQYWYFYYGIVDTSFNGDTVVDIFTLTLEDSIQFLHGAGPAQWPDSAELTGIKIGGSFEVSSMNEGSVSLHQNFTITGDIAGLGDVVINGNGQLSLDFDFYDPSCSFDFNMNQTISNLQLNITELEEEGCPTAGTIRHVGAVSVECTGDTSFTFSDTWSITQTFSGDYITTVFENSTTVWTVTHTCGGGSTAPWSRFKGICRNLD